LYWTTVAFGYVDVLVSEFASHMTYIYTYMIMY